VKKTGGQSWGSGGERGKRDRDEDSQEIKHH